VRAEDEVARLDEHQASRELRERLGWLVGEREFGVAVSAVTGGCGDRFDLGGRAGFSL
jgi:hypothetical protein